MPTEAQLTKMIESLVTTMPFFMCLYWTCVLALEWRRKGDELLRWLLWFMLACTILYFGHCVFFNRYMSTVPMSDILYVTCNLLVFPLYYMYVKGLTVPYFLSDRRRQKSSAIKLTMPALLIGVSIGVLYMCMGKAETAHFIEEYLYHDRLSTLQGKALALGIVHLVGKGLFMLEVVLLLVFGLQFIRRYNKMVDDNYADVEDKKLHRVQFALILFVLAAVLSFVSNLLGRYRFTDSIVALATASFLFTTLIFLLGYVGLVQEFSVRDIENDCANDSDFKEKGAEENSSNEETTELKQQEQDEKNNDSIEKNTSREQMRWLGERISNLMEEEQVYLQHDLRIIDLAYRLNTNRTYIQRAILEIRKCSFSEYINQLRIDYADRLLEEHPEYAITEIAERSGYTSLSTFYRNYRSIRGRTPKAKQE